MWNDRNTLTWDVMVVSHFYVASLCSEYRNFICWLYFQTMLQDTTDQAELRVFPGPLIK